MAITAPISTRPVTEVRRTARASIEVPRSGPQEFVIYREKVLLDDAEAVVFVEPNQVAVRRRFDAIGEEAVTLDDGLEITGDQLVEALSKYFDRWADEDIERSGQAPVMPIEPAPMVAPPMPTIPKF